MTDINHTQLDVDDESRYDLAYNVDDQGVLTGKIRAYMAMNLRVNGRSRVNNLFGFADTLNIDLIDGNSIVNLSGMNFNDLLVAGTINGMSVVELGVSTGLADLAGGVDGRSTVRCTAGRIWLGDKVDGVSQLVMTQTSPYGYVCFVGKIDGESALNVSCNGTYVWFQDKIDGGSQLTLVNIRADGAQIKIRGTELSGNSVLTLQGNFAYYFDTIHFGGKVIGGTALPPPGPN